VQSAAYLGLLALSLVQLVLAIDPRLHAAPAHPITSVLWLLTILIGLPFVDTRCEQSVIQAWYARSWLEEIAEDVSTTEGATENTRRRSRIDSTPFPTSDRCSRFSIYPWLVEPRLSLPRSTIALVAGFGLLAAVCAAIALSMRRTPSDASRRLRGGGGRRVRTARAQCR
jgi:hypothetical protein